MTSLETIKALREKTGASLQACKKALEESHGDEPTAIEILRKKGEAHAAARTDRQTHHGAIGVALAEGVAVILHLGCETDFVAKTDDFVQSADELAQAYLQEGENYDPTERLNALQLKMGEKVAVTDFRFVRGEVLGDYIHNRKVGALVALDGATTELARDIAMHITAMRPLVLSPDEVSEDLIEKERGIWREQLQNEGKPQAIFDKILEGKEKKFREEHALLKQPFVKNPDQTIEQLLNGVRVKGFVRLGN